MQENSTNLISNSDIFKIPVEEFQEGLSTLAKEKQKAVLDLLINHSQINSNKEFEEVKQNLKLAIKRYDLELIEILLREEIKKNNLILKIDRITRTASLFMIINPCPFAIDFTVPHSVKYEGVDYTITSIIGGPNKKFIKSLHFDENSEVNTIYENSFNDSNIKSLYIPKNLTQLKDGWCENALDLTKIEISPLNTNFIYKDNRFLLGKTDPNSDNFDVLLFVRRDILKAVIPSNITIISPFAFDGCNLKSIEIQEDSNLRKISQNAFIYSKIESIYFPSKLSILENGWFDGMCLKKIEISPSNKNFVIKDDKYLLGKTDQKSDNFDILLLAYRFIEEATIPASVNVISSFAFSQCELKKVSIHSKVKSIESYAFDGCMKLEVVDFGKKSNLMHIGEYSFNSTGLTCISIPSNVLRIDDFAFYNCYKLEKVSINENSKLKSIGKFAFSKTGIECFYIPQNFEEFGKGWNLEINRKVEIKISPLNRNFMLKDGQFLLGKTDQKSDIFNVLISASCDLEEAVIPSSIKIISPYCFNKSSLKKVTFPKESKLEIIGESAFENTNINEINIPSSVLIIGEKAFYRCQNLSVVNIHKKSILRKIGSNAFYLTDIKKIFIPASVTHIYDNAFFCCHNLQVVFIAKNSELKIIDENAFSKTSIEKILLPKQVLRICSCAFSNCVWYYPRILLQNIQFSEGIQN